MPAAVDEVVDLAYCGALEDDLALLVALRRVDGELISPAKTGAAELAHDVVDEVTSSYHHPTVCLDKLNL